jgi:hypothetical protein
MKILYELDGKQILKDLHITGSVRPEAVVLWDERVDGVFPGNLLASVGGLDRVGNALVVNAQKLAAFQAAQAAAASNLSQKQARVSDAKQKLNDALLGNADPDLSPLEIRRLFRFIRIIMKDVANQLD